MTDLPLTRGNHEVVYLFEKDVTAIFLRVVTKKVVVPPGLSEFRSCYLSCFGLTRRRQTGITLFRNGIRVTL